MGRVPQSLIIAAAKGACQRGGGYLGSRGDCSSLHVAALRLAQRRLGGGQTGDRHPQGGAGDVVQTEIVAEADAGGGTTGRAPPGQLPPRGAGRPRGSPISWATRSRRWRRASNSPAATTMGTIILGCGFSPSRRRSRVAWRLGG